jgi:hypothetical protein
MLACPVARRALLILSALVVLTIVWLGSVALARSAQAEGPLPVDGLLPADGSPQLAETPPAEASIALPGGMLRAGDQAIVVVSGWNGTYGIGPEQVSLVPWAALAGVGQYGFPVIPLDFLSEPYAPSSGYVLTLLVPENTPSGVYYVDVAGDGSDVHTVDFYVKGVDPMPNSAPTTGATVLIPASVATDDGALGTLSVAIALPLLLAAGALLARETRHRLRDV